MLEKKVFVENGEIPPVVGELKHKVEHLREKLEVRWQHIFFINICRQWKIGLILTIQINIHFQIMRKYNSMYSIQVFVFIIMNIIMNIS